MPGLAPRVALVHDWLTGMRGGEKVLEVFCELFPKADVFTLVHIPGQVSAIIESHSIYTSPLQKLPGVGNYYRHLLPLMPWAIEQFDLAGYDLVISSSHCVAKGVQVPTGIPHWSYCHTPMRYVWDQYDEYFGIGKSSWLVRHAMRFIRPFLQRWDHSTVPRVTKFLANSRNVQERIRRLYQRDAEVVYPPVDYAFYSANAGGRPTDQPYFLIVSALVPYKRVDLAIAVFNELQLPLIIIGDGPDRSFLEARAGATIKFLGWQPNNKLRSYDAHCEALIFPGVEDFGIVPLEVMGTGRPVIAFRKGGALETVREGETGIFFDQQTEAALKSAVLRHMQQTFLPGIIQAWAKKFDRSEMTHRLRQLFVEYVE